MTFASPQTAHELDAYVQTLPSWNERLDDDPVWMRSTTDYGFEKVSPILAGTVQQLALLHALNEIEPVLVDSALIKYVGQGLVNIGVINAYVKDRDTLVDPDGWYGTDVPVLAEYLDGYLVLDGTHRVASDRIVGRATRAIVVRVTRRA